MTAPATQEHATGTDDTPSRHEHLRHQIHHYAHMLSEQGPMNISFVHNNTLLGLQHLHFDAAIREAHRVLGSRGYEPLENFRRYCAAGRITDKDLLRALDDRESLALDSVVLTLADRGVTRREVLYTDLRFGCDGVPFEVLDDAARRSGGALGLPEDLPEERHSAARAAAAERLAADLAKLGERETLSEWLSGLLGLPVSAAVRAAAETLLEQDATADIECASRLMAIGVPDAQASGYLRRIDTLMKAAVANRPAAAEAARVAYLTEEARLLDRLARRHWGVRGTVPELRAYFEAAPEALLAQMSWAHLCRVMGIDDPLSPSDPVTLAPASMSLDLAERAAELTRFAQESGDGLPVLLNPALHAEIVTAVTRGRVQMEHRADVDCVERHLRDDALGAAGLAALLRMARNSDDAALADLVQRLAECDAGRLRAQWVAQQLEADLHLLHHGRTHADWLLRLTGVDLVERVNHSMIRLCAAFTDEGLAAWRMPDRDKGFYHAWRLLALADPQGLLEGLDGWQSLIENLPVEPEEAILQALERLGVAEAAQGETLGRMLAQLKGWAGMAYWYELHPNHYKQSVQPIDTVQYLAVRLTYESMWVRKLCREVWGLDGHLESLQRHFTLHPAEYFLRLRLFDGGLDDSLADQAQRLLGQPAAQRVRRLARLADQAWLQHCLRRPLERAAREVWPCYRLVHLMGLTLDQILALDGPALATLKAELEAFPEAAQSPIWLDAYEAHYRDEILNAIAQNVGRGRWAKGRSHRPRSQLVLCIDEREENIHRHYGELDPEHETLGAAGFYGVAQSYSGLDDHDPFPRCPAVATPAHRVLEIPRAEALRAEYPVHKRRNSWKEVYDAAFWETKRNAVSSFFLFQLVGLLMAVPLIGRVFAPGLYGRLSAAMRQRVIPPVRTRLTHLRIDGELDAAADARSNGLPVGFSVAEGADRVEAQLRNWGLTFNFARIVVTASHRSISVNNPHENAHDCGACSGKPGGANARLFAALANDPQVRTVLRERGIDIPDDTWFVGAEHNTASSEILCFDTQDIPAPLQSDWQLVAADLEECRKRAARERCRRFGSAPKDASLQASLRHVEARTEDLSQVRPEWGHCTNAFAVVGRRCVTQGLFLDRRGFVISYDPTQDADGRILERILLAVGPVGAGINLEYYFSTVDPDRYGCGTKVPHNVTGMIGVMSGAHSDLQTGLPRQMTEVHEAMRLQLIVDAKLEHLGEIYGRNPGIQQLLDNQWVHLIAHVPDSGELHRFVPGKGFVKWDEPLVPIPEVKDSFEWFKGKHECFLPPARIAEPTRRWNESVAR